VSAFGGMNLKKKLGVRPNIQLPSMADISKATSGWGTAAKKARAALEAAQTANTPNGQHKPDLDHAHNGFGLKNLKMPDMKGFKMPKNAQKVIDEIHKKNTNKVPSFSGLFGKKPRNPNNPQFKPNLPKGFKMPKLPKLNFGKWAETFAKMVAEGKETFAQADLNHDDRVDLEELTKFIIANLPGYQAKHAEEFKLQGMSQLPAYYAYRM